MVRVKSTAAGLAALLLLFAGVGRAQLPPGPSAGGKGYVERKRVLIVSDNQEHLLTGAPLRSMGNFMESFVSSVAIRSPLANVGGRLLFREALEFGQRQGAELVLHMGDAADISCPDEIRAVFNVLDEETPGKRWFMAPGNHDGLLAGNLAGYQPRLNFKISEPPSFYRSKPGQGYGADKHQWLNACLSPRNYSDRSRGDVLTRGDFIRLYLDRLKGREEATWGKPELTWVKFAREGGLPVQVTCMVEEVELKPLKYKAIARVCPRKMLPGDSQEHWVGPYSSFIVQKLDVGGTPVVMLDTSDYLNATDLFTVPLRGEISLDQKAAARRLIEAEKLGRENVIIAGHHPLGQLRPVDREWIVERAARYISGHAHYSASFHNHEQNGRKTRELNVGSTLDNPPQAVIAHFGPDTTYFRVAGAEEASKVKGDYLQKCADKEREWALEDKRLYEEYKDGLYVERLLDSLRAAAERHDDKLVSAPKAPAIPGGAGADDWLVLDKALEAINNSEGDSRDFWACQAFYASKASGREKSFYEKYLAFSSFKRGDDATGGWREFSSP